MKINFSGKYKSLSAFETEELSDFCIITGKNGAGKTQLLESVNLKYQKNHPAQGETAKYHIEFTPLITKPQFEGVIYSDNNKVGQANWHGKVAVLADSFLQLDDKVKNFLHCLINDDVLFQKVRTGIFPVVDEALIGKLNIDPIDVGVAWNGGNPISNFFRDNEDKMQKYRAFIVRYILQIRKSILFAHAVCTYYNKPLVKLRRTDFFTTPLDETILENSDLFSIQIEGLFYNYAKNRSQNDYLYYRKKQHEEENGSIPDSEFIKLQPPPWETINNILEEHKIKYFVKGIEFKEFSEGLEYDFYFTKKENGKTIRFSALSTGEQIIIGLILKLFIAGSYSDRVELPNYLFLDEPDAHLHPEMSKLLLDVLYTTFVQKLKIHVIITTHDPSTIALAPEGCIYEMQNEPITSLKKVDKDYALKILTNNLPLLSIDYKNHRQVFVESPTDIDFYQVVFDKFYFENHLLFKLYFISTSAGKSNCDEVKRLVKILRDSGNQKVFGLIDWDNQNKSNEQSYVIVHGEGIRYSIENFLLDPLYLAAFFLDQGKNSNGIERSLGFQLPYNQFSIGNESNNKLQEIADWIIKQVKDKFYSYITNDSMIEVEYFNGKKIRIPDWYLNTQGHELATKTIKTFKSINYFKEADLMKELIQVMGKCYPLIPRESIDAIKKIGIN